MQADPNADAITAFLAKGGVIQRCPTAMCAITEATLPAGDRKVMREHNAAQEARRAAREAAARRFFDFRARKPQQGGMR